MRTLLLAAVCVAGGLSTACGDTSSSKDAGATDRGDTGTPDPASGDGGPLCPATFPEDGTPCSERVDLCYYHGVSGELLGHCLSGETCEAPACSIMTECSPGGFGHWDGPLDGCDEDAGCRESFDCTARMPCCDDAGDLVYVEATCCGDDGFPGCPEGYDYSQCSPEQRCADSPSPLPDCFDGCGQPVEPTCENWGERDVWECPTARDAGADCADAG